MHLQRIGAQCTDLLGFTPVPAEASDQQVRDDVPRALTGAPLAAMGNNPSLEHSQKPNAAASSMMTAMLQEGSALGSSPEKRKWVLFLREEEGEGEGEGDSEREVHAQVGG
jgi:hypothetical protein